MNHRLFWIAGLLMFASTQVFAHALWIETSPAGKKGQAQEVRVFWGEYADKDIAPLDKWFSDTRSYTLTLITPDRKEIPLHSAPGQDHYKAFFTPETEGVYTVVLKHTVKDLYHGSKLDYHASASVLVGNGTSAAETNPNNISIYTVTKPAYRIQEKIVLQALLNKLPAGSKEVEVVAPNGWGKKLWTDSIGNASFTPLWPGRYLIELTDTKKETGDHHGQPFQAVWRCATYCIEVK